MYKVVSFIDFWNFQLNWNKRTKKARFDWRTMPNILLQETRRILNKVEDDVNLSYQGIRIYASVNPKSSSDKKLTNFLNSTLRNLPGFFINIAERKSRLKPIWCSECNSEIDVCPKCGEPFKRAAEKGVDTAIVTDMFALHIDNVYDIAILMSSDADMVPMVTYLQNRGTKVINVAWRGMGYKLKETCWASFDLDSLSTQMTVNI